MRLFVRRLFLKPSVLATIGFTLWIADALLLAEGIRSFQKCDEIEYARYQYPSARHEVDHICKFGSYKGGVYFFYGIWRSTYPDNVIQDEDSPRVGISETNWSYYNKPLERVYETVPPPLPMAWRLGLNWNKGECHVFPNVLEYRWLVVPIWAILGLITLVASTLLRTAWLRHRTYTRSADGRCTACGYDLRATTRCCPECGLEINNQRS